MEFDCTKSEKGVQGELGQGAFSALEAPPGDEGGREGGTRGDALSCGLARLHGFIGGKPIQVTVSHVPGIEPCRCSGNTVLDA